ncbi:hypothetical protein CP532_3426 [Ophiocordyceps camponoti-leonardi (nom. inval.)]|nr:hypothetical protein CP532_3426 [Ophiocordyceps camponoti-leonardi (nom. inval.)]
MDNADLIALVFAEPNDKPWARHAIEASSLYVAPSCSEKDDHQVQYGRHDEAATELPEESNGPTNLNRPRIEIRFSDMPRTRHGIVFGCDPNSDVVLPNLRGISKHHFSLTFDDENRLIVRDWGSRSGTEVTYDDQSDGKRCDFRWIIGGDVNVKDRKIVINIHSAVQFRVVAAEHGITSTEYVNKVHRFRQGTAGAEDLFRNLSIPKSLDTKLPAQQNMPSTDKIYLQKFLGRGGHGAVRHFWNVSNGHQFALKEPIERGHLDRVVDRDAWEREIRIMKKISHPHIVRLFNATCDPHPQLLLSYAPAGSLEDQQSITPGETISILQQCLSALTYLHEKKPPIVHRDIKPGNILVQHRSRGNIYVMFGDFGIARDNSELSTICGTRRYLAPEVYSEWKTAPCGKTSEKYSPAVDVWSLGVVAFELNNGLPKYSSYYNGCGAAWCHEIIQRLVIHDDLGRFLRDNMVIISPKSRSSARKCYELASRLSLSPRRRRSTSEHGPCAGGGGEEEEEEQTTLWNSPTGYFQGPTGHPQMACASDDHTITPPSSSRKYQKRAATSESPSSPSSPSAERARKRRERPGRRRGSVCDRYPDPQTYHGPESVSHPNRSSMPQSSGGSCYIADEEPVTETNHGARTDEGYMSALLRPGNK